MKLVQLNRDPRLSDFSKEDLVLNTTTGDLFAKTNNKLFKIASRNEFNNNTTDEVLQHLNTIVTQTSTGGSTENAIRLNLENSGFYSITTLKPTTGSGISMHGGLSFDYGQPLPNSPYIKTNGGFDILMDNANSNTNSAFRVFKDTGLAGISPGVELFKVDENGNLTVAGSISGSSAANTDIDGGSF